MIWYKSANSNSVKPKAVEVSGRTVFVRKDFVLIPAKETEGRKSPEHYKYLECKMTFNEYALYEQNIALRDYVEMIS